MESKSQRKKEFVLDCLCKEETKLKKYESEKDIFLAGYFAVKRKRNGRKKNKFSPKGSEYLSSRNNGPSAYLSHPNSLKQCNSYQILASPKKSTNEPLSSQEFKELLSKYRMIS